jgi:BirA family biotin operon repressor/biotin-[acetyl-CoA-carboxylase] ligase
MDEVAARAAGGAPEGTLVVADHQTTGRGRAGRAWEAPPGGALMLSALLRPPLPPDRLGVLPLVVGVAVAEALELVAPVACQLKWPNDVWIGGRKVAGILASARARDGVGAAPLILGIGINVATPSDALPAGATSLAAAVPGGRPPDREDVLAALLLRLDAGYRAFLASGGRPDLGAWRARAALLGEVVAVVDGGQRREGRFVGVDADGALLLAVEGGETARIVAGDLTRGPVRRAAV